MAREIQEESEMRSGRNEWDRFTFAEWLRVARARQLPRLSQRDVADQTGIPQAKLSRWENPPAGDISPPTLKELAALVDALGGDFLELARMVGEWDDDLERRVLVAVATREAVAATIPLTYAGVAQPGRVIPLHPDRVYPFAPEPEWVVRPIQAGRSNAIKAS